MRGTAKRLQGQRAAELKMRAAKIDERANLMGESRILVSGAEKSEKKNSFFEERS